MVDTVSHSIIQAGQSDRTDTVDPHLETLLAHHADDADAGSLKLRRDVFCPVLPQVARQAARAIEDQAARRDRKPQDFATALLIALSRRALDRWVTASFTVGDDGVALFDADADADADADVDVDVDAARVDVLCRQDSGEFDGQTRFLTTGAFRDTTDVLSRVFVDVRDSFTVLAAMTDGITDPKFPTDAVFARQDIWRAFWQDDLCAQVTLHPENPDLKQEMLAWLDCWSRGDHDDRTIALMIPDPQKTRAPTGAPDLSGTDKAHGA